MKHIVCWILAVSLLFGLIGCEQQPISKSFFAMDTVMTIQAWGRGSADAVQSAIDTINTLEQLLSVTRSDSDIARLNACGHAVLSGSSLDLLQKSLDLCRETNGALDITLGSVTDLWGFRSGSHTIPDPQTLRAALADCGWQNVRIENGSVSLPDGMQLDLGAVAKGYAAMQAAAVLADAGISRAVLSLGGNVQTLGEKADGTDWIVGVTDPFDTTATAATLSVSGSMAIVTSGGYQRFFEEDGTRYHHILDPETGCPANGGLASVTIVAQNGLLADAMSTALYVMGLDEAKSYCLSNRSFEALLIADDGCCWYTSGLSGRVTTQLKTAVIA